MSGIAGVVRLDGGEVGQDLLERFQACTPFLGREGVDKWRDGPAGMVRFALRLTPEALTEIQPARHPGSGALMVMDGRLDNRADLRRRLGPDAPPASAPDCEIVLAAFERFGDETVRMLAGDYALAIWRPRSRRLFCARSPVGWRPLLWTFDGKRFGFATEPRTLVDGLGLERRLNEGAIGEHLAARFTTQTDTLFADVFRLPPGSALALERGDVRVWRWNEGPYEDHRGLSDAGHVERFKALIDQALVAVHRSNGTVASHLSGGLDSSTVVCRSLELHRGGAIARAVQPISTRFYGEACDEGPFIEAVERHTGVASLHVSPLAFDSQEAATFCRETLHQPLRPNVLCIIKAVCERLKPEGIRVLLTGEGGDNWLNGSRGHWPDMLLRGQWLGLVREGLDQGGGTVAGKLWALAKETLPPVLSPAHRARLLRPHLDFSYFSPDWIRPEWARKIDLYDRWRAAPDPPPLGGFAQSQRYHVFNLARSHVYIDNLLCYVSSQGMELRHPFHDMRLASFMMGCPGGLLQKGGVRKHLLREAMRGTLPEEVRTRGGKANFTHTLTEAILQRFRERRLEDMACVKLGWVDPARLTRIHQDYEAWTKAGCTGPFPRVSYAPVWNAISVDLWLENVVGL